MEVLKLAGTFRRDLTFFEHKTRDRLSVLADRMSMHAKLDIETTGGNSSTTSDTGAKQSGGFHEARVRRGMSGHVCDVFSS